MLLDEPFSSLDANLRGGMRELVKELQREGGYTTVFVTHDQEEAVVLADRIALLQEGRLLMYDEPQAFFDRPASRAVAEFFGGANFIPGEAENGHVRTPLGQLSTSEPAPPGAVTLTIRPEAIRLDDHSGDGNTVAARVVSTTYLGRQTTCVLEAEGLRLRAALPPRYQGLGRRWRAGRPPGRRTVAAGRWIDLIYEARRDVYLLNDDPEKLDLKSVCD